MCGQDVRCLLVVRASSSSCTSSMPVVPVLWERWVGPHRATYQDNNGSPAPSGLTKGQLKDFKMKTLGREELFDPNWWQKTI